MPASCITMERNMELHKLGSVSPVAPNQGDGVDCDAEILARMGKKQVLKVGSLGTGGAS